LVGWPLLKLAGSPLLKLVGPPYGKLPSPSLHDVQVEFYDLVVLARLDDVQHILRNQQPGQQCFGSQHHHGRECPSRTGEMQGQTVLLWELVGVGASVASVGVGAGCSSLGICLMLYWVVLMLGRDIGRELVSCTAWKKSLSVLIGSLLY
ncbi:hypothetical protein LINPERHAP2_LOCUS23674, partial [Linum perenne]